MNLVSFFVQLLGVSSNLALFYHVTQSKKMDDNGKILKENTE